MTVQQMIDVHAHVYPAGCFAEVIKSRADFKLVDNPRGQSLLYRGSHVMSMPTEQDNLPKRLASMDEAGIGMAVHFVSALKIGWGGHRGTPAARIFDPWSAPLFFHNHTPFSFHLHM